MHSKSSFAFLRPVSAALLLGVALGRGILTGENEVLGSVSDIPTSHLSEDRQDPTANAPARIEIVGRSTSLERNSASRTATRELLPARFREFESPHFIIFSDADAGQIQRMQEQLERAHDEFHRFCRRVRLTPEPLRHKLVSVLFAERTEYREFARKQDAVVDPSVAGYYAPSRDRAVFYDARTNPSVVDAEKTLSEMAEDLRELERESDAARQEHLRQNLAQYEAHYHRERAKLERFVRQVEAATTVHEAIHQLLYHTGIQSRQIEYPVWIAEGLATTFETDNTSKAFGPDQAYHPRQDAFRELLEEDRLLPLETLILLTPASLAHRPNAKDIYHQSYALTRWLLRTRPAAMRDYLDRIRREPSGEPSPKRLRQLFEASFGAVNTTEHRWLRDESRRASDVRVVQRPDEAERDH